MQPTFKAAIPILPAADVEATLAWWIKYCGFQETFRDGTPAKYAGLNRDEAFMHVAAVTDSALARTVGNQTMVRFAVKDIEALYAEYQANGGVVHPNGPLTVKPWGTREFSAIDPTGVCITFYE